jgi:hypothetical protein
MKKKLEEKKPVAKKEKYIDVYDGKVLVRRYRVSKKDYTMEAEKFAKDNKFQIK